MIIVLSGPGGVGKGTIAALLVRSDPQLALSRSWTTRARRPGEDASAYVFATRSAFDARREAGGFLEWNEFLGNLYGTPVPDPESIPAATDLLLEIDVNGARQVAARDPDALLIFVDAPDLDEQRRRLVARGDPIQAVERRLVEGAREREIARDLGCSFVINDEVDRCLEDLRTILAAARAEERAKSTEIH